jgi:hypothetical protein
MNDFAMQNDRPTCRTNVRELPVARLGHPPQPVRMASVLVLMRVIAHQLHLPRASWVCASCKSGCSVSFLSPVRRSKRLGFRTTTRCIRSPCSLRRAGGAGRHFGFATGVSVSVHRNCGEIIPAGYVSWRNVFPSSARPSISAMVRCNDSIAGATCLRKCL